jgi:GNAT superfamily N-acetyltransferase
MLEAANYSAVEMLRDGRRVEIRALRPDDRADLIAAVARSSGQSLYRRFFAVKRSFTASEIDFFLNVDFVDHVALVAVVDESSRFVIAGGARYVVVQPGKAEVAFAVVDQYQGQGLGAALMHHLATIARRYGATKYGPAYLAAAFAFTNHWMSTDRIAVFDHLSANFDAQSYGGRLEGGYRFGTPYGGITPYAAIQAQSFHTPGYTETDAIANGFALTFNSRDAHDTRSELGTRFDRVLAVYSNAVLALRGRVAWAHDSVSDPTLLPGFQALPGSSFIVNGATLPKNSALTSAGAELRVANGVTLLAKFDGEFASHSSTYAGTGTFRYRW